jgi:hypothetical protein
MKKQWLDVRAYTPASSGWYLVVVEGHGTRHLEVDNWCADDVQWGAEYRDNDVQVTHFQPLPELPPCKPKLYR